MSHSMVPGAILRALVSEGNMEIFTRRLLEFIDRCQTTSTFALVGDIGIDWSCFLDL